MFPKNHVKGRGAQEQIHNRFEKNNYEVSNEFLDHLNNEGESINQPKTVFIEKPTKSPIKKT